MKTRFLFPSQFRIAGLVLLLLAVVAIYLVKTSSYEAQFTQVGDLARFIKPYSGIFPAIILGFLLIAFSKEKIEDEHIAKLRLESLQWAININYAILFYCFLFVKSPAMISLILLNLLTPLVFFIIRFRVVIYKLNNAGKEADLA